MVFRHCQPSPDTKCRSRWANAGSASSAMCTPCRPGATIALLQLARLHREPRYIHHLASHQRSLIAGVLHVLVQFRIHIRPHQADSYQPHIAPPLVLPTIMTLASCQSPPLRVPKPRMLTPVVYRRRDDLSQTAALTRQINTSIENSSCARHTCYRWYSFRGIMGMPPVV
jgi:hypothetical protein